MRVLITGSRAWPDARDVYQALNEVAWSVGQGPLVVVHGKCFRGADRMAAEWCRGHPLVVEEPHPASWSEYGKAAGFIRNAHMVDLGADLCLAFIHNRSRGASHCATLAESKGIETRRITRGKA